MVNAFFPEGESRSYCLWAIECEDAVAAVPAFAVPTEDLDRMVPAQKMDW